MNKKRNFTLLETIISLLILSIILTFLMHFFVSLNKVEKKIEIQKIREFEKSHLNSRLNFIFSQTKEIYLEKKDDITYLNVTFDNAIDIDQNFSKYVFAKIYLKDKKLLMDIYSLNKKIKEKREEILFENVEKINFSFLPKEVFTDGLKKNGNVFLDSWPKENNSLPYSIVITINEIKFAFFIPRQDVSIPLEKNRK